MPFLEVGYVFLYGVLGYDGWISSLRELLLNKKQKFIMYTLKSNKEYLKDAMYVNGGTCKHYDLNW